MKQRLY